MPKRIKNLIRAVYNDSVGKRSFFGKKIGTTALLLFVVTIVVMGPLGVYTAHAALPLMAAGDTIARGAGEVIGSAVSWFGDKTFGLVFNGITNLLFILATWFLGMTGNLLDTAITYSISPAFYDIPGIVIGWGVFRDIVNIAFIAILVYIAIGTILQLSGVSTKQMLVTLVVVALLVNFSFFLANTVIRTSNTLASALYGQIMPPSAQTEGSFKFFGSGRGFSNKESLSGKLINGLDLPSMVDSKTLNDLSFTDAAVARLLGAIAIFIAAFVFLAGAILFILRIVTLAFVLLISPLAFAAAILPATNTYWNQWLSKLMGNAFVAPAYMLFLFAIIAIVQTKTPITLQTDTLASVFDITKSTYDYPMAGRVFLNYAVIIGLLLGAQKLTQTMASGIAGLSVKYAGRATGFAMGATAFAGRRTIGRGFRALANSEAVKNLGFTKDSEGNLLEKRGWGGKVGRFSGEKIVQGAQFGAQSTFDVRAGKIGAATSGLAGIVGADFGKSGGRGGFEAIEKGQIKRRVELGKALATTQKGSDERKQEDLVKSFQEVLSGEEKTLSEALKTDTGRKERL
ncbi:MAG TPA: hypothetical protein VJB70_01015 [Candidatus Paceibacterota bacterium]